MGMGNTFLGQSIAFSAGVYNKVSALTLHPKAVTLGRPHPGVPSCPRTLLSGDIRLVPEFGCVLDKVHGHVLITQIICKRECKNSHSGHFIATSHLAGNPKLKVQPGARIVCLRESALSLIRGNRLGRGREQVLLDAQSTDGATHGQRRAALADGSQRSSVV